jgi:hypothetical protein
VVFNARVMTIELTVGPRGDPGGPADALVD